MKKILYGLNVWFDYFSELNAALERRRKAGDYEKMTKPQCLASSCDSRWFILWYSVAELTTAINSPLVLYSMHCLQASEHACFGKTQMLAV